MNKIIKNLIYQKKYPRYKMLFYIELDEIIKLWFWNFINIFKNIKINEEEASINYFHLKNEYFKDYFDKNKKTIFLWTDNIDNSKNKIDLLEKLEKLWFNFKLLFKLKLENNFIKSDIFDYINKKNYVSFLINSDYKKKDMFFVEKIKKYLFDKDIYFWLDLIENQDKVENENIFKILEILKNNWSHVNIDFSRLESAYRWLYIFWPKELHLDLSEYCNTSCNFCWTNWPWFLTDRDDNENKYKITFSWKQYSVLFEEIQKSWTESIALWITWEPFLHPEIRYILERLNKINIWVWFLTNGYKLLENLELIIKNKNIKHFYINISSWNLESFNLTRKWDNFENFLNTRKAIKLIRKARQDIVVRWLYVITPQNICWIDDFIKLAIKNDISEIELKRVVPYEFSNEEFNFDKKKVNEIILIIKNNKKFFAENNIKVNENFDYIINDFLEALKNIQYPEDEKIDKDELKAMTNNCYNPYFYISIFRNDAFSCWKFIWKIWKLEKFNLFNLLFEKKEVKNIISWATNLKDFLWENVWKRKCSRCHHMDVNNMVKEYIKIKKISLKQK